MTYEKVEAFRCPKCHELDLVDEGIKCPKCGKLFCFFCINDDELCDECVNDIDAELEEL